MGEGDTRRWSLRSPGAEICNHNIPTAMLVQWARQGIVKPGYTLSSDGETWVPAETLPELGMTWYILASGHPPYGPVSREAAERFVSEGHFPTDALITEDPGSQPVSAELPLPMEPAQDAHLQELEETRKRLVLLERELRLKDRRIDELRQEAEARQCELNMEGAPDPASLSGELERLRLEHAHLKAAAQEAAEAAAGRERELRQRIGTLETALEAAQTAAQESPEPQDAALYAVLSREAEWIRKSQEEEERFLGQLRELARQRETCLSDRLVEIRRLIGDSPEQMRAQALRGGALPAPRPAIVSRRSAEPADAELAKALDEARARESELQRRLVAQEGREAQLRAQIGQAERRTLDALKLDEKLRETAQALERERAAREEEHRENAHIQEQLLRRIEELERLVAQSEPPTLRAGHAFSPAPAPAAPERPTFGWLRKR